MKREVVHGGVGVGRLGVSSVFALENGVLYFGRSTAKLLRYARRRRT